MLLEKRDFYFVIYETNWNKISFYFLYEFKNVKLKLKFWSWTLTIYQRPLSFCENTNSVGLVLLHVWTSFSDVNIFWMNAPLRSSDRTCGIIQQVAVISIFTILSWTSKKSSRLNFLYWYFFLANPKKSFN